MLSTLERIKYHYSYVEGGDEGKILHYDNVINEIDDLITEMRDAEVNPGLAKGRSRRVPGRGH